MLKDLPVQVEKPSVSSLVVEVHPHGQHDVVAPVVLRLGTKYMILFIISYKLPHITVIISLQSTTIMTMIKTTILIICLIFCPFNKLPCQVCYVALQTGYCKG